MAGELTALHHSSADEGHCHEHVTQSKVKTFLPVAHNWPLEPINITILIVGSVGKLSVYITVERACE